jgi:hypothetical protein
MIASVIQAAGELASSQNNIITTEPSSLISMQASQSLTTGAFAGGVSSSAQMLTQRLLEETKSIFPVVAFGAGRLGSVAFSEPVTLQWKYYE